jgi:hypothetical protein
MDIGCSDGILLGRIDGCNEGLLVGIKEGSEVG